MRKVYAVTVGLALSCQTMADWRDDYRLATLADAIQTQYVKSTHGWEERSRLLKRLGRVETLIAQFAICEIEIWAVSRMPKEVRPILGVLAVLNRLAPVLTNARKGVPSPFVVPVLSLRF